MSVGELLTRGTVWLALACYAVGEAVRSRALRSPPLASLARWLWTIGGLAWLAHIMAAFHFYHGWSHAAAYADTARQTEAKFGFNWGGGIYFNYLFALLWLTEAIWWWREPEGFRDRPRAVVSAVRGFFLFMVFNATVVFPAGPIRWFGLAICVGVSSLWLAAWRQKEPGKFL